MVMENAPTKDFQKQSVTPIKNHSREQRLQHAAASLVNQKVRISVPPPPPDIPSGESEGDKSCRVAYPSLCSAGARL